METQALTPHPEQLVLDLPIAQAGQAANAAAAKRLFGGYRARLAEETRRRHDADLACFTSYLVAAGVIPPRDTTDDTTGADATSPLASDPTAWRGVTWGLVAGFVEWQLQEGYAVGSINVRLSTVKSYARLATRAGVIAAEAYALIKLVPGFRHAEGRRVDAQRETKRKGTKKAQPVSISASQAAQLKDQADARDRLLMCLLLDHGLRVGEVAALVPDDFDLDRRVLRFYRSKVDKTQTHKLSEDVLAAAEACHLVTLSPGSTLFGVDRTIRTRVKQLGEAAGLVGLSPHDCRHFWATAATRAGTPIKALQDAGGWASPAMPLRYAESAEIANEGVRLREAARSYTSTVVPCPSSLATRISPPMASTSC